MLARLHAPPLSVLRRSVSVSVRERVNVNVHVSRTYTTNSAEPLRILFCGSDEFSIPSLLALDKARRQIPNLIETLHVAHRPAKPTGRGLKLLREVPIAHTATSLALPTHPLDTFTHYTPPFTYNLVIAVSFGLLIPARILAAAKHGGINLHPSLLPDLRGAAPIEHAILQQRKHTGVSVQTLHPHNFDAGVVLSQTPPPGLRIERDETAHSLRSRLATLGADMLLDVLREGRFLQPLHDCARYEGPVSLAPKITKEHSRIDFGRMHLRAILATHRALGDTWCLLPNGERLVMHALADAGKGKEDSSAPPGLALDDAVAGRLLFRASDGRVGVVEESTYPGGKRGKGNPKVAKLLRAAT